MNLHRKAAFVAFTIILCSSLALAVPKRCEKLQIPFCKGLGYNTTIFPNNLDHDTQDEARQDASEFNSLVEVECSPDIAYFLCSLYAPMCTVMNRALPPCRLLCQNARSGCESLMNKFGFKWPKRFECENFPKRGLCVGRNVTSPTQTVKKISKSGKKISVHKIRKKKCAKESDEGKFCCKLGRRAAKKGYFCNLRKKENDNSRKAIKFRKTVVTKCSKHSACFRSCCEVYQRKRRNSRRRKNSGKEKKNNRKE